MTVGVTWVDAAQVVTAAAGLIVAGLVAVMPHLRRPKLRIEEERDKANSRVEASIMGGMPHVRILVRNAKRRRAAKGTRVLIEGYRPKSDPGATITTLGHPSLEAEHRRGAGTAAVTVFAGGARPITLGYFIRVRRDPATDALMRPAS
jgi:hypothetical protein